VPYIPGHLATLGKGLGYKKRKEKKGCKEDLGNFYDMYQFDPQSLASGNTEGLRYKKEREKGCKEDLANFYDMSQIEPTNPGHLATQEKGLKYKKGKRKGL
jgi:hypothetical protein